MHIRLFILEMSFHDLHYLSSLPHPFSSLSPNMHTAVHMHGDGYMTCMYGLFYSFTPYQNNVTPLYVASQNGHHDVVQTLVGAGADVNIARSVVSDMVLCSCTSTCTHCKVHALLTNVFILYRSHFCTHAHILCAWIL